MMINHILNVTMREPDRTHPGDPSRPEFNTLKMHTIMLEEPMPIEVFVPTVFPSDEPRTSRPFGLNGVKSRRLELYKRISFLGKSFLVLPCKYMKMRFFVGLELSERKKVIFYYTEDGIYRNELHLHDRASAFQNAVLSQSWPKELIDVAVAVAVAVADADADSVMIE